MLKEREQRRREESTVPASRQRIPNLEGLKTMPSLSGSCHPEYSPTILLGGGGWLQLPACPQQSLLPLPLLLSAFGGLWWRGFPSAKVCMKSAYFAARVTRKRGFKPAHLKPGARASHGEGETACMWYQGQQVTQMILADCFFFGCLEGQAMFSFL